jgi:hypothetical protein
MSAKTNHARTARSRRAKERPVLLDDREQQVALAVLDVAFEALLDVMRLVNGIYDRAEQGQVTARRRPRDRREISKRLSEGPVISPPGSIGTEIARAIHHRDA